MPTKAEKDYQRALRAWRRATNPVPKSFPLSHRDEAKALERLVCLQRKANKAREALRAERLGRCAL